MKAIQPYLFFNGSCQSAMQFYADLFDAPVQMMTYGQNPACSAADRDRVMHASLTAPDGTVLMASDAPTAEPLTEGENYRISIACDSREEQERLFAALSDGGHVTQPLQDTFWGAHFGMLEDRFGTRWMLSHHAQHSVR